MLLGFAAMVTAACEAGAPSLTPPIVPGASGSPREVNLIAKDYSFLPDVLDLAPGETVLLHVINGGLEVHEAVIGDAAVQDAWEVAEAATVGSPPGPTPVVSVPPGVSGPPDRREVRRACRPGLDGPGRVAERRLAGRLPHPRSLGTRDADPRAVGRWRGGLLSAPDGTLPGAPTSARSVNVEEGPEWRM